MRKPELITFTGVDEHTDLEILSALSALYPGKVEWGVLVSRKQQAAGNSRYPSDTFIESLRGRGLRLAAHLCGAIAERANQNETLGFTLSGFNRVQVNHGAPNVSFLTALASEERVSVIAQSRDPYVIERGGEISWLYDCSGGRGVRPEKFPEARGDEGWCGYAGGIGPDNVLEVLAKIDAPRFWIDMESGVRDTFDRFDLDKVRSVLETVYGPGVKAHA